MRYDFRCNICRQKSVFHCEHDTPYRDQYLGISDENTSGPSLINSQRLKNETKTIENNGINQKRQGKSNAAGDHAHNQQDKKHENKIDANPENKPTKSCTIL
jgi:hypothetical protein